VGKPKRRDHLEDLGVEWRIILKCIFKVGWGTEIGLIGSRKGQVDSCEIRQGTSVLHKMQKIS